MSQSNTNVISIKIEHRGEAKAIYKSGRDAFWGEIISLAKASSSKRTPQEIMLDDIDTLEARIEHELGPSLRTDMIRDLVERPLSTLNHREDDPDKTKDILGHYGYMSNPLHIDPAAIIKLAHEEIDYLRQMNAETPQRAELRALAAELSPVFFSAKVAGYESLLLDLDLVVAPVSSVAKAFRHDITAFTAFLESHLPSNFTFCLPQKFRTGTPRLRYTVVISESFVEVFKRNRVTSI